MQLISSPKRLGRSQANGMGGEFAVPATLTYRKLEAAKLHRPEYFAALLQTLTNDHSTLTYSRMGHEVKSDVLSLTS